ncbi:MAG: hypothetical protein CME71_10680 [Halobacteriovorax sp.]|nr:hypothetical protein [Halobacteriovorax sp.]
MNSIVIFEHELEGNCIAISDAHRLTHLNQVIKPKPEQELKVTILGHGLGVAKVTKASISEINLELTSSLNKPDAPEWHLIVGLSRPPTMKKILEHASCMGVTHFHFFCAKLSEKSYLDSKIWSDGKAEQAMIDGLAQSAHFWRAPKITHYKKIGELPRFEDFDRRVLSLSDGEQNPMKAIDKGKKLVLAFGPERGFTADEDQSFRSRGFQAVSLGPSVLRVEIAVFASLAQAQYLV